MTVTGLHVGHVIASSAWESPYIHLTNPKTTRTFDQVADIIDIGDYTGLDDYLVESKPLCEGTSIAMYGNIRLDQGEPVIAGTDETPLVLTDLSFDDLRKSLGRKIVKHGLSAVVILAIIVGIWRFF